MAEHEARTQEELIAELSELRQSELRVRSLIEEIGDPLFCYEFHPAIRADLPTEAQIGLMYESTLVECNDACARLYGAGCAADIVGKKLTELFATTPPSLDELFRMATESGYRVTDGEASELLDDGTRRHLLINAYGVVQTGLLLRIWGTIRDVTEQKRAEKLLSTQYDLALALGMARELEEALRVLTETAIDICGMDCGGVYLVDPISKDLDLAFHMRMPPGFVESASHCTADSASGRLVLSGRPVYAGHEDLGVPMDRERRQEGLRALAIVPILDGGRVIACLSVCSHSLDEIPAFARTALEAIAAQVGSTIASAQALEALHQGQANLQALLDSLDDLLFVLDAEGTILQAGKAAVTRLGYSPDELVGEGVVLIHPPNRRREAAAIIADIVAGKADWNPLPLMTKGGKLVPAETSVLRGSWNGQDALFSISRDLTRRRRTEGAH